MSEKTMRNTITVREIDVTPILTAIERARLRLLQMPARNPKEVVEYASVVLAEIGYIIDAKNAYDAQVAEAVRGPSEPEIFHSPKPTVLN